MPTRRVATVLIGSMGGRVVMSVVTMSAVVLFGFCFNESLFGLGNVFFLLVNDIGLHWIVLVVVSHEVGELELFLEWWCVVLFVLVGVVGFGVDCSNAPILADIELVVVVIVSFLISGVINGQQPPHNRGTTQIVHGQIAAPLIFVL